MASFRDQLNQQLAEVASGKRTIIDQFIKDAAASEEIEERRRAEKRGDKQTELLRAATIQLEATAQEQAAHHERMEWLEQERNDLIRGEAKIARAREINSHLSALRRQKEEAQLTERQEETARLQSSPCYASANQLFEFKLLELAIEERSAVEELRRAYVALGDEFRSVYEPSKAAFESNVRAAVTEATAVVEKCSRTIEAAKAEIILLKEGAQELGSSAWFKSLLPKAKREKAERLAECEARLDDLMRSIQNAVNEKAEAELRTPEVLWKEFTKRKAVEFGVMARIRDIDAKLDRWLEAAPRTSRTLNLFPQSRRLRTRSIDLTINYQLCVALDHARSQGATVEYPGLGKLVFGIDLADVVIRSESLRKNLDDLDDAISTTPRTALDWLRCAHFLGVYEPHRDLTREEQNQLSLRDPSLDELFDPSSEDTEDALADAARTLAIENPGLTMKALQAGLRIGYNRASELYDMLKAESLV